MSVLQDANSVILYEFLADPVLKYLVLSPVVDGDFLPDQPSNLFHNTAEIDYLAGINNMDGHLFTSKDIPSFGDKNKDIPV